MFDVGFWEVSLIAIVALVVVGPERLPRLARTVGLYVGKARRVLRDVRSEIDREINRAELGEIKDLKDTVSAAKSQIDRATADVSKTLNENVMSRTDTDDADADLDVDDNTIHNKSVDDKADEASARQPAADPPMPAALRAASMSGGAASASSAISAAAADSDTATAGDGAGKKTKPEQTGNLPIPPEDKSDDDY